MTDNIRHDAIGRMHAPAGHFDLWEVGGWLEWWADGKCSQRTSPIVELLDLEVEVSPAGQWAFPRIIVRHVGETNGTVYLRDVVRAAIFVYPPLERRLPEVVA